MDMLVDYASDDDDDDQPAAASSSSPVTLPVPSIAAPPAPPPSLLPSAAQLFDAPASSASPSASSLPRKRPQVNGSAHPSHQPKVPRSSSSSARTPPGSTLVPPQLRGRSNVATEDLDKLFVQRQQRRIDKKFKAYRNINLGIVTICDHCKYVVEDALGGSQVHNNYIVSTCFECGDKVTSPASGERNSEPAVLMAKMAKLENTQRIRRIDSRHVPPNRSLSSQRYQLGDAAATAPHVLNRGIRNPSRLKTWPRADVRVSPSNRQMRPGNKEMVGGVEVKDFIFSQVALDDNILRRRLNTAPELREFESERAREQFSLQWNVFDLLPPDSLDT